MSAAAYFELLMNLTRREVKGRYSQSFFGVAWAIVQPLSVRGDPHMLGCETMVHPCYARFIIEGDRAHAAQPGMRR